jgi:Protein of unknown function (DUF3667)
VSHVPQRKEKDCLNCGITVVGRFCHECGQENVEPKETFWHMVTHFFYDITHFDSKFFESVKDLIIRPGFLSKEYMLGRRASYLHPVRMYVFTSAIFFLLFFSFYKPNQTIGDDLNKPLDKKQRADYIVKWEDKLKKDTGNKTLKKALVLLLDTSKPVTTKDIIKAEGKGLQIGFFTDKNYKSLKEYNSAQKKLSTSERDSWFKKRLTKKEIEINQRYEENPQEAAKAFTESILHRLPYMLFVSLPLFALILKLVYIRRKQFYYADHGVFTIHLYIFTFLLLLAVFGLSILQDATGWGFITFLIDILYIILFFYLYKAMRNFYCQRRAKTVIKFLIVALFSFLMMLILFLAFMFFSAITF